MKNTFAQYSPPKFVSVSAVILAFFALGFLWFAAEEARAETNPEFSPAKASPSVFAQSATPLRDSPPLNHLFGKPAIIVLFQPNCGYCKVQMRTNKAFIAENPGFQTFAISEFGSHNALERMLNSARTDIKAYKSSGALLKVLGYPSGSPRTFLVDSFGRIILAAKGTQSIDQLSHFVGLAKLPEY